MKWITHHLMRAMGKFKLTGCGNTHRRKALAKLVARAYTEAALHGITSGELSAEVARTPGFAAGDVAGAALANVGASVGGQHGGGGGRGVAEAAEVGLVTAATSNFVVSESQMSITNEAVKAPTTKLLVSSQSQVEGNDLVKLEDWSDVLPGNPEINIIGLEAIPADGEKGPAETLVDEYIASATPEQVMADLVAAGIPVPPEVHKWPHKAKVHVLGPCMNPNLYRGVLLWGMNGVSLQASAKRRWKAGDVVEAELVRGGGSPVYRAIV